MKITVTREPSDMHTTLGVLRVDGIPFCDTLEDTVREITGEPVSSWKIPGETAIPQGTYKITLENSNRFGPDTLTVNGVEGFSAIRIHAGNTDADTHGCLLVGVRTSPDFVAHSRDTLAKLRSVVVPAIKAGEEVTITYINGN